MSNFDRIDLSQLYQPFVNKAQELINNCNALNKIYIATCGLRTYEEQAKIYAKGRTTGTPGKYLTKAKPGQSPHNFGIAIDFCLDNDPNKPGLQPNYDDKEYKLLADEAIKLGLDSGYYWHFQDTPHIQWPIKSKGITWDKLDFLYKNGGIIAVFSYFDTFEW